MATAQVESATSALIHDDQQTIKEPQEEIQNTKEETDVVTAPQEDQLPKEPAVAPEPDVQVEPEAEPEALAAEVETKVVITEEEIGTVNLVDQTSKVAPEPCVEEQAKPEAETETEPTEEAKVEPDPEPEAETEEKVVEKEVTAAEE